MRYLYDADSNSLVVTFAEGRTYPAFLTKGIKKPPPRAIKLSVSNNLMAAEAAA